MSEQSVINAYRRKLASNPDGQMDFDTVEILHPLFSKRYLLVVGTSPLTATLETGELVTFEPTPMDVAEGGNNNDTDQQASFTLPDVGNLLDDEMSRLPLSDTLAPVFTFRSFVSTDLSYPARGPVTYDLQTLTQSKGVFTADVGVPRLNERQTGILMTPQEIPLLRGVLAG
jgi:Domain of unknown function (DUF1833)